MQVKELGKMAEELALARRRWVGWLAVALAALALMVVALVGAGAWLTLLLWDRLGAVTPGILRLSSPCRRTVADIVTAPGAAPR